jgi:predicted glycoside hydrolase/deacetylase ChbG (UPF0249 family)
MRRLIVNADDFGLNDAATDGIAECFLEGTVTSTTLMVNAPAASRAAQFAADHPQLGVGLHFNLTWGQPLSPRQDVPALVDANGQFWNRTVLAKRLLFGKVPRAQVEAELKVQLTRLKELGVQPSHIDSHQHVHAFPDVFHVIAEFCAKKDIPMRTPWVAPEVRPPLLRRLRRFALKTLIWRSTRAWRGKVAWNDGLGSVFDVQDMGMPLSDAHYRRILSGADGNVFELMVHPVTDASAMDGFTRIGQVSEAEWGYLRTGQLSRLAEEMGFVMSSYRDLTQ